MLVRLDQLSVGGAQDGPEPCVAVEDVGAPQVPIVPKVNESCYKGQYWCIPENFQRIQEIEWVSNMVMWSGCCQ